MSGEAGKTMDGIECEFDGAGDIGFCGASVNRGRCRPSHCLQAKTAGVAVDGQGDQARLPAD
jgi:hypothetical protein